MRDREKGSVVLKVNSMLATFPGGLMKEEKMENSQWTHGTQHHRPQRRWYNNYNYFSSFDAVIR